MKNKVFTPFIVAALSLSFGTVCLLLAINKKNPGLLKAKLKLGAMIITLTAVTNGCGPVIVTCYVPPSPSFVFNLENQVSTAYPYNETITINASVSNRLSGHSSTYLREYRIEFQIRDNEGNILQNDYLIPVDGVIDSAFEEFELFVDQTIPAGHYTLSFHSREAYQVYNDPELGSHIMKYNLDIVE